MERLQVSVNWCNCCNQITLQNETSDLDRKDFGIEIVKNLTEKENKQKYENLLLT